MTSYSQSKEDVLMYEKFFKHYKQDGQKYFFEMGAIDGVMYNNTKYYEDTHGWTGILVEGNPFAFTNLVMNRPKCKLISAVVSDSSVPLKFTICANVPAVCSVKNTQPESFENEYYRHSRMVEMEAIPVTLDSIIKKSGCPRIDLAVLDVEGHELNVLNSYVFKNQKVPVISWLIETFDPLDENNKIKTYMEDKGYECMGNVAHNAFFIHKQYKHLFGL